MATGHVSALTTVLPLETVFSGTKDEVPEVGACSKAMVTVLTVPVSALISGRYLFVGVAGFYFLRGFSP